MKVYVATELVGRVNARLDAMVGAMTITSDQRRDIAVVPSRPSDPGGDTMLWLLQDGAHPVASAEHVLEVIHGAGARGPALQDPTFDDPALHGPALHEVAA